MSCKVTTLSFSVLGASFVKALAILRVKLSLRRLPTMTTTLYGVAMGIPFDAGAGTACPSTLSWRRSLPPRSGAGRPTRTACVVSLRSEDQITGFQAIGISRYLVPSFSTWPIDGKVKWKPEADHHRLLGRRHVVELVPRCLSQLGIDVVDHVPVRIAQEELGNVGDICLKQDFRI